MEEIVKSIKNLQAKVGPKSDVTVAIDENGLRGSLYTKGITQNERNDIEAFGVYAYHQISFEAALAELERLWLAEREKRGFRIIEKMALEIIRLTADLGECTDAALRAEFGTSVESYADAALLKANEMASNGPFKIQKMRMSNAA